MCLCSLQTCTTIMSRTFGLTCTKAFLIIYNFLFLISGGAFLAAGIWLHFDTDIVSVMKIMDSATTGPHLESLSYILMGIGAFILLMSFLGCCGACCESMCMLCLYSCLLFLVLATEITGGILAAIFKHKIVAFLQSSMQGQVKYNYNRTINTTDFLTKAWDRMQINFDCCGSIGPQDYRYSNWFNQTQDQGNFVPATCCKLSNDNPDYPMIINENQCQIDAILFPEEILTSEALKTRGCHDKLLEWLQEETTIFIVVGCSVGALQILGLTLACCLMAAIRREQSKYPWYIDDDDE
jgi:hypothetical protein